MRAQMVWAVVGAVASVVACAAGESTSSGGGGQNAGGFGNVSGTGGQIWGDGSAGNGATGGVPAGGGGAAGSGGSAGSGGGAAGSGGGNTGGATSGGGGSSGSGGSGGDAGPSWPTCDTQPSGVPTKTVQQIWADNPTTETQVWVPGVYVTAISGSGCANNTTCQIFVQQAESYASLAAGAKQAIKLRVASTVAQYFTGLAVGDKVDVLGYAWRYNLSGANEMAIQINSQLPGCAKKVGTGTPAPITGVQLTDLSVGFYEQTHGPLLVQLSTVTGKPAGASEIFGLWKTGVGIGDAGPENLVNASPFFLPNGAFTGLPTNGTTAVDFTTLTGVFSVFIPVTEAGSPPKYMVMYPRAMSEMVH
ncbi:MAG: hypothetical protein HS104_25485 [Polyangiaceae bacterium]|nr:hypothetical protein [Polyangiaceae bacterium]MCL4754006.1 hypothetical protein [Myxococcales bacterium]